MAEGAIGDDHILGELGEIIIGRVEGRISADDRTIFKSLGLAVEDLAAAHHLYGRATATGEAMDVMIGGRRDEDT